MKEQIVGRPSVFGFPFNTVKSLNERPDWLETVCALDHFNTVESRNKRKTTLVGDHPCSGSPLIMWSP